ncbi:MAG TPA: hypothetical protein PLX15_01550 [Candidatus Woesearchaeota archaeon]|nr:hypothetical protein [Candidatus Woesearchaeota archaeon]
MNCILEFRWLPGAIGLIFFSLSYYFALKEIKSKKNEELLDISLLYFLKGFLVFWFDLNLLFFLFHINSNCNFAIPTHYSFLIFICVIIIQFIMGATSYKSRSRKAISTMNKLFELRQKSINETGKSLKIDLFNKYIRYLEEFSMEYSISGLEKLISEAKKAIEDEVLTDLEKTRLLNSISKAKKAFLVHSQNKHFNFAIIALSNIEELIKIS